MMLVLVLVLVMVMTLVMLVLSLVIRGRLILWRVSRGMTMVNWWQRNCIMLRTAVLRRQ